MLQWSIEMRPKRPHFKIRRAACNTRIAPMRISGLSLLLSIAVASLPVLAADIGTVGPTYEIAEPDLIEVIKSRLDRMARTGELARKAVRVSGSGRSSDRVSQIHHRYPNDAIAENISCKSVDGACPRYSR
jgi:hypothetical protein